MTIPNFAFLVVLLLSARGAFAQPVSKSPQASLLWGENGEKWTPQSRLPFFGLAGYHCGRDPIPAVPTVASVRDFGATGDGTTDDSAAILRAVRATQNGALFFPPGRYVLTATIPLEKSRFVLRGAGPEQSVLVMPKSLQQLEGVKRHDSKSNYAFSGGFVEVHGAEGGAKLADVAQNAARGDRVLTLTTVAGIQTGDWVRLRMTDSNHTLGRYLHADQSDAGTDTYATHKNKPWIDWAARVQAVAGARITLDRPLRLDVRLEWKPQIWAAAPTLSEVGIENLGFEFAGAPKKPHLQEEGFNAIEISRAFDCWVRAVTITDADNGIALGGSRFCTVENVRLRAAKRQGITGHHGLWAKAGSQDCLFTGFDVETRFVHDLCVAGLACGNVFRDGSGQSLNFDHHRDAPYENLFCNLDVGNARRVWESGGRADRGPNSAARATFWNIRKQQGNFPTPPDWPQINVIGMVGAQPNMTANGPWIEPLPASVAPPDLYKAQSERATALLKAPQ